MTPINTSDLNSLLELSSEERYSYSSQVSDISIHEEIKKSSKEQEEEKIETFSSTISNLISIEEENSLQIMKETSLGNKGMELIKKIKKKQNVSNQTEKIKQTRRLSRMYLKGMGGFKKRPISSKDINLSKEVQKSIKQKRFTVTEEGNYRSLHLNKLQKMKICDLPDDILIEIYSFLEPEDLGRISSVCRRWLQLAELDPLWENLSKFYYPKETNCALQKRSKRRNWIRIRKKSFYKEIFVKAYQIDLHFLKTGIWKNSKWKPKKSPFSKEEYILAHKSINQSRISSSIPIKVVVVGDGAVGKTSLLIRYVKKEFPNDYVPTVFDNYSASVIFENQQFSVSLWDTAGPEDYDRLRPLSYIGADIFLLCFDLVNSSSFQNGSEKWIKELQLHAPNVPVFLCGTKMDLRRNRKYFEMYRNKRLYEEYGIKNNSTTMNQFPVTFEMGCKIAKEIGAVAYMETSALTGEGVDRLFQEVMKYGCMYFKAQYHLRRNPQCSVM